MWENLCRDAGAQGSASTKRPLVLVLRCGAVDFSADGFSEHSSLAETGAPGALSSVAARFAGMPAPDTCR